MQAVMVIAGVLIFAYFDPFGLFSNNKLTLRDTPAQVKQIKEIGELISAEYYGEVISSYKNIIELQINDAENKLRDNINDLDSAFRNGVLKIKDIEREKQKDEDKAKNNAFEKLCDSLSKNEKFYSIYISEIRKQLGIKWYQGNKRILDKLLDDNEFDKFAQKSPAYCNNIFDKKKGEVTKDFKTRKIRKSQLILLGRGKVQAGFKFNKLNDRNVKVDTIRNRIILVGMKPEILSCDINPWFIPELGMKGFEIIDITGKLERDVNVLRQVKENCLDSLYANALESDILNIAKENAEQDLKQFFSLLLNTTVEVKIVANELDYYTENIFNDSLLSLSELSMLDSLTDKHFAIKDDSNKVRAVMDTIKKCKVIVGNYNYNITPFTLPAYILLVKKDTIINTTGVFNFNNYRNYKKWFYNINNENQIRIKWDFYKNQTLNVFYKNAYKDMYVKEPVSKKP